MFFRQVTFITVNYKTPCLIRQCVESVLAVYPEVHLIVVDNGSHDESTSYIRQVAQDRENVRCILNVQNRYHGPALDQGIRASLTPYVFALDSDCRVHKRGFLEDMLVLFDAPDLYAAGIALPMNRFGFECRRRFRKLVRYVRPHAMLLDRRKYLQLRPFIHHGSPGIRNMADAQKRGYEVVSYPIHDFIYHAERGTCSRYGYGLDVRTSVEEILTKLGLFI